MLQRHGHAALVAPGQTTKPPTKDDYVAIGAGSAAGPFGIGNPNGDGQPSDPFQTSKDPWFTSIATPTKDAADVLEPPPGMELEALYKRQLAANIKMTEDIKDMKNQIILLAASNTTAQVFQSKYDNIDDESLRPIDRKIILKPTRYTGDIGKFQDFQEELKDYLSGIDGRWRLLM